MVQGCERHIKLREKQQRTQGFGKTRAPLKPRKIKTGTEREGPGNRPREKVCRDRFVWRGDGGWGEGSE